MDQRTGDDSLDGLVRTAGPGNAQENRQRAYDGHFRMTDLRILGRRKARSGKAGTAWRSTCRTSSGLIGYCLATATVPLTTERVSGIEPEITAWEAVVLPLHYTRVNCCFTSGYIFNTGPEKSRSLKIRSPQPSITRKCLGVNPFSHRNLAATLRRPVARRHPASGRIKGLGGQEDVLWLSLWIGKLKPSPETSLPPISGKPTMHKSKPRTSQTLDPILAGRILAKLDPASAAIFADVLCLAYDPDQPRDDRGRWSKVGRSAGHSATRSKPTLAQAPPLPSGPKRLPDWNTPTNPSVRDNVKNYDNLGSYPKGFTLSLQFRFPNHPSGTNWIRPLPSPQKPNVPVPNRVSYFGNSGVYIYNAIEVQIINQNSIDRLSHAPKVTETGPDVKVQYPGFDREAANTLVTGIPYGVGAAKLAMGGKPENNLQPRASGTI